MIRDDLDVVDDFAFLLAEGEHVSYGQILHLLNALAALTRERDLGSMAIAARATRTAFEALSPRLRALVDEWNAWHLAHAVRKP